MKIMFIMPTACGPNELASWMFNTIQGHDLPGDLALSYGETNAELGHLLASFEKANIYW